MIVGRPNAGKSSLFNALAGAGRAIVTDVPGTTRDLVTEIVDIDGVPVTLVDTAGLRATPADAVEAEGIARARAARGVADLVDRRARSLAAARRDDDRALLRRHGGRAAARRREQVRTLPAAWTRDDRPARICRVSALTGDGLDELRAAIARGARRRERAARHAGGHERAPRRRCWTRRASALDARGARRPRRGTPEEFVLADLNEARGRLEEITGARTPDDVLHAIFETFCIGK